MSTPPQVPDASLAVSTPGEREIRIERIFCAPRERVWRAFTDPALVAQWWGRGNRLVVERLEVERGGHRRFVEHSPDGVHGFEGRFREVAPPERLVYTFEWDGLPGYVVVEEVIFAELEDGRTRVVTTALFHTAEERDGMLSSDMEQGLAQSYAALDRLLASPWPAAPPSTPEEELRQEFEEWFRAAAVRDLDAVMTKIAPDVVAYEHEAPLQYLGAEAVREVCRRGFEAVVGDFRWDVPDLRILVRDDVAVTWGLNRMRMQEPGKEPVESWSRGTRIFRRIDGRWQLIHQHVSFPYDPETGEARFALEP